MDRDSSASTSQEGLPELLRRRARASSNVQLALAAGGGVIAALVFAIVRPPVWFALTCVAVDVAAFGGWGILDREFGDRDAGSRQATVLRGARFGTVIVGTVAAVAGTLSLLFVAIGRWIS